MDHLAPRRSDPARRVRNGPRAWRRGHAVHGRGATPDRDRAVSPADRQAALLDGDAAATRQGGLCLADSGSPQLLARTNLACHSSRIGPAFAAAASSRASDSTSGPSALPRPLPAVSEPCAERAAAPGLGAERDVALLGSSSASASKCRPMRVVAKPKRGRCRGGRNAVRNARILPAAEVGQCLGHERHGLPPAGLRELYASGSIRAACVERCAAHDGARRGLRQERLRRRRGRSAASRCCRTAGRRTRCPSSCSGAAARARSSRCRAGGVEPARAGQRDVRAQSAKARRSRSMPSHAATASSASASNPPARLRPGPAHAAQRACGCAMAGSVRPGRARARSAGRRSDEARAEPVPAQRRRERQPSLPSPASNSKEAELEVRRVARARGGAETAWPSCCDRTSSASSRVGVDGEAVRSVLRCSKPAARDARTVWSR